MDLFQHYQNLKCNGSLISLEYLPNDNPYFCYPVNAKVIGFEGTILYCFLPEYEEMVFASNPESCTDKYVYPLAKNFQDFLSLILACGSANPIEQIIWLNKEQFNQHLHNEMAIRTLEQTELLEKISAELHITPMDNPFEYVKALQAEFDDSKIQYSEEYYTTLGIESPENNNNNEEHLLEFEPVQFTFKTKDK